MTTIKQLKPKLNFLKRNHRPILQNVMVQHDGIYCTDLETTIVIKDNIGLSDGLHNINTLGLCEGDTSNLDDYPSVSMNETCNNKAMIPCTQLKDLLQYTSKDETRLHLMSIAIDNGNLVATSGTILKSYPIDSIEGSYLMPSSSIKILLGLCKLYKLVNVQIHFNDTFAVVDNSMFSFKMRLIQREYVKWQNIVPKKYEKTIKIDNWIDYKDLKPLINKSRSNAVIIKSIEGTILLIPSKYPDNQYVIGNCDFDFEIGFNCEYLNIAASGSRNFEIKFNNEVTPILVNGATVMPLRL